MSFHVLICYIQPQALDLLKDLPYFSLVFFRQDGGSWSPDKRSVPRHGSVLSRRGCYDHEESSTSITSSGSTAPRRPTCKLQLTCAIISHICFDLIYGDVHYYWPVRENNFFIAGFLTIISYCNTRTCINAHYIVRSHDCKLWFSFLPKKQTYQFTWRHLSGLLSWLFK